MKNPIVYMIGGPNGAGKTTVAFSIMPAPIDCYEYINADAIASALSPFKPGEVSINAGRLMLTRIHELAEKHQDFAFESTMASRSFVPFLRTCKSMGYEICLIYIWLKSPDLAVARVAQRVESGGHFVEEKTIRSRYSRGLRNFFKLYLPLADSWAFYDNSRKEIQLVAHKPKNDIIKINISETWNIITEGYLCNKMKT